MYWCALIVHAQSDRLLAKDILYRRKMGFDIPLASWFRGPLRSKLREALLGSVLGDSGLFNRPYLERLIDQHQSGVRDNSTVLWPLLMYESFLRKSGALADLQKI